MAKQKLAEAGYSRGFSFEYLGLSQYPNLLTTGEVIQSQLAKIGVTMNINQMEVTAWLDKYAAADYQATTGYWAGTVDPDNFYSNIILTGGPDNFTKYSNPAVDTLITQANTATTRPSESRCTRRSAASCGMTRRSSSPPTRPQTTS